MALFYFHIFNDDITIDDEGIDLPDPSAAMARASTEALVLAAESVRSFGHLILHHRIEVEDARRDKVGTVCFGDVVSVRD
jgi:hypothetical protein